MPGLSSQQKAAVSQFVGFTQIDKRAAEKILKTYNWNMQQAIDAHFSSGSSAFVPDRSAAPLNKLFDKYRESPQENPDLIGINGTMQYLQDLDLAIDSITVLVLSELVASPTLGEITRQGFINGWSSPQLPSGPATTIVAQRTALTAMTSSLPSASSRAPGGLFRRVYKHTFKLACPAGSKSVPLEMACEYWKLLFGPTGAEWRGSGRRTPWLEWWMGFLESKWKKAVNRDLWDQTCVFEEKVREDESLAWWSEDSAWPGVIDDFVDWARTEKGVGVVTEDAGAMETE